jgi:hypothetical protein
MSELAGSNEFSAFVRDCIPSLEAAAVLVCMAREPERDWSAAELVERLGTSLSITLAEIERAIELFEARGLVERRPGARARMTGSYLQARRLATLVEAYDHQPVTLVQLIHAMREERIRMFSDAFRIRKD